MPTCHSRCWARPGSGLSPGRLATAAAAVRQVARVATAHERLRQNHIAVAAPLPRCIPGLHAAQRCAVLLNHMALLPQPARAAPAGLSLTLSWSACTEYASRGARRPGRGADRDRGPGTHCGSPSPPPLAQPTASPHQAGYSAPMSPAPGITGPRFLPGGVKVRSESPVRHSEGGRTSGPTAFAAATAATALSTSLRGMSCGSIANLADPAAMQVRVSRLRTPYAMGQAPAMRCRSYHPLSPRHRHVWAPYRAAAASARTFGVAQKPLRLPERHLGLSCLPAQLLLHRVLSPRRKRAPRGPCVTPQAGGLKPMPLPVCPPRRFTYFPQSPRPYGGWRFGGVLRWWAGSSPHRSRCWARCSPRPHPPPARHPRAIERAIAGQ